MLRIVPIGSRRFYQTEDTTTGFCTVLGGRKQEIFTIMESYT